MILHIYRCITQQEVLNKFKNVDKELKTIRGANTHTYQKDLSYIHFFRYKKFAQYYFNTNSSFFKERKSSGFYHFFTIIFNFVKCDFCMCRDCSHFHERHEAC